MATWHDLLDDHVGADIVLVDPDPTDDDPQIAGHLIIIQRPAPDACSIFVSVMDNAIWNGAPRRWALRSSSDPTGYELTALMGYRFLCPPHVPTTNCQLWYRHRDLPLDDRLLVRHGMALTITILREIYDDHDAVNFLQRSSAQQRQRIDLPAVVEAPIFTELDFRGVVALRDSLLESDLGRVGSRASVVKWHDATCAAFDETPDWSGDEPTGFAFFSDGSSAFIDHDRTATAAVVLIVYTKAGPRFGGFRCFALGNAAFAPQAEMTAVTIAILWAQQLLEQYLPFASWIPVTLHFDCLAAGYTAAGQWTARTHTDLQHRARALVHWVESRFQTHIVWEHVYAHSGHLGTKPLMQLPGLLWPVGLNLHHSTGLMLPWVLTTLFTGCGCLKSLRVAIFQFRLLFMAS